MHSLKHTDEFVVS